MRLPSTTLLFAAQALLFASPALARQSSPPPVSSGTLVLHLQADPTTVAVDANDQVLSWTASNDASIVLARQGTLVPNITYDSTGMRCSPTVVFTDSFNGNEWLQGVLPAEVSLSDATIFWLGYYATDTATYGRYSYSIGKTPGVRGQLTHASDDGLGGYLIELYDGAFTWAGDRIDDRENRFRVWRTEYFGGSPAVAHRAFVDGIDLNVQAPTGVGYDVGPDPHPIYVGSWENQSYNMVGAMSDLVVYQGVLSSTDAAAVEAWLAGRVGPTIGAGYCGPAETNSLGRSASLTACGSLFAADNHLVLEAIDVPPGQFGYFLTSKTQGYFQPPSSQGFVCLAGNIGRFNGAGFPFVGPVGRLTVDLTNVPQSPPVIVQPGETWNFQAWYRDKNPNQTSNFTDAVGVTFQ